MIKTSLAWILMSLLFFAQSWQSHNPSASNNQPSVSKNIGTSSNSDLKGSVTTPSVESASSPSALGVMPFILSKIDEAVSKEFEKAWQSANAGIGTAEGVVLLYRLRDGSLRAKSQGHTHEYKQFTFKWNPTIIGIVHTHPNGYAPEPNGDDLKLADRLRVPIFTITNRGMFVYDPATKKTSKLYNGLDWLKPSARALNVTTDK